jgi:hypothetical protein
VAGARAISQLSELVTIANAKPKIAVDMTEYGKQGNP